MFRLVCRRRAFFHRNFFTMSQEIKQSLPETAFSAWIEQKRISGELWLHEGLRVQKDPETSSYGLYVDRDIINDSHPVELFRISSTLHNRFSGSAAEESCKTANPEFYKSIVDLIDSSIAPSASAQRKAQLISSICLAVQILVVSNDDKDADLRPYLELLVANAYPRNSQVLPHPLVLDNHVDPVSYLSNDPLNAPAFDLLAESGNRPEILRWLMGTPLHRALFVRKRLYNNISRCLFRGNGMNKTNFDYAMGVVLSRSVSGRSSTISIDEDGTRFGGKVSEALPLTLVPFLDFSNHSAVPSAEHVYNADRSISLYSRKTLRAGDEVTIGYGDRRDSLSFMSVYGFLPRESSFGGNLLHFNIADSLDLHVKLPARAIIADLTGPPEAGKVDVQRARISVPLVELFSLDVEAVSDAAYTPKERIRKFQQTLYQHLDPYFTSLKMQIEMQSSTPATEMECLCFLLDGLEEQHKQLRGTRFWERQEGKYLARNIAEERFLDDCQHWVDIQVAAVETLGRALTSYLQAMQAEEGKETQQ